MHAAMVTRKRKRRCGRKKNSVFDHLLLKINSVLSGWKLKNLNAASKIQLIKSVLSSIPIHTIAAIYPTKSVLSKLEGMFARFLWGSSEVFRRKYWCK